MPPQPKKTPHPKKPPLPKMPPHPKKPQVPKVTRTSRSKRKKQHEMMQTTSATKLCDLPLDLMVNILSRVAADEKLWNVREVCRDWRKICKDPSMWRVIYINSKLWPRPCLPVILPPIEITARKMCKNAVDRSQGQLVDITMSRFCDDELLEYVADRSPKLSRLQIAHPEFSVGNLSKALKKLPKLEELSIICAFNLQVDQALGSYCPQLKTLRLNFCYSMIGDEEIIAICENLRELRHFEVVNNRLSNTGLLAILDGCPCLKVLDLRMCPNVDLKGDIRKRLEQQIECVLHSEPGNGNQYIKFGYFMDLDTIKKLKDDLDS